MKKRPVLAVCALPVLPMADPTAGHVGVARHHLAELDHQPRHLLR